MTPDPPPPLSADEILLLHEHLGLVTDSALIVRAIYGDRRLLAAHDVAEGMPLTRVAPELAPREADLQGLLSGRTHKLEIGLSERPISSPTRFIWAQTMPLVDASGQIVGVSHLMADATNVGLQWERGQRERREAVELRHRVAQLTMEAVNAQADMRRLDDAKSHFVSAAAHELRNPLASLIGFLELMQLDAEGNSSDAQRAYLEGMSRSALRLRQLTNNLLDITRIDANRIQLSMEVVDALELVEQAVSELQPLIDAKGQQLLLKADPGLPLIWCDRARAMQILVNLLSNAHKYTPQGGAITLQASRHTHKSFLRISIKDSGIGIPLEDQQHLFTRFYRAANAGAAAGAGAGLGLALTQSLVQLHGGQIWFESQLGKGSTFHVTFPIAE